MRSTTSALWIWSAFYLDVIKDRLYTLAANDPGRRAAQTVLYIILRNLVKMIAPVLVHTAEEIWRHMPAGYKEEESVHLVSWPGFTDEYLDPELEERWDRFMKIREEVSRALEKARADKLIGSSLEARVRLFRTPALQELVGHFREDLATLFIVSQVETEFTGGEELEVKVERALGDKCQRCWIYHEEVGANPDHPGLCPKCLDAIG